MTLPAVTNRSNMHEKMDILSLSSLGFPDSSFCNYDGSTLHFTDTGETYIMVDGTWETDSCIGYGEVVGNTFEHGYLLK